MKFINVCHPSTSAFSSQEAQAFTSVLEAFAPQVFPTLTRGSFLLAWKDSLTDNLEPQPVLSFDLPQGACRCNFSVHQQELSSDFVQRSLIEAASLLDPEMLKSIKRRTFFNNGMGSIVLGATGGQFVVNSCFTYHNGNRYEGAMRSFCSAAATILCALRPKDVWLERSCQAIQQEFTEAISEIAVYDSDATNLVERTTTCLDHILTDSPTSELSAWRRQTSQTTRSRNAI